MRVKSIFQYCQNGTYEPRAQKFKKFFGQKTSFQVINENFSNFLCNVFLLGAKLVKANVIKVKQEDKEVFEALACDSFAVK